uniref:Putative secreted protein n=1 Tax=Ixodes scapularis TaxID=6945 RepID=A0A4D5RX02_IXOSC
MRTFFAVAVVLALSAAVFADDAKKKDEKVEGRGLLHGGGGIGGCPPCPCAYGGGVGGGLGGAGLGGGSSYGSSYGSSSYGSGAVGGAGLGKGVGGVGGVGPVGPVGVGVPVGGVGGVGPVGGVGLGATGAGLGLSPGLGHGGVGLGHGGVGLGHGGVGLWTRRSWTRWAWRWSRFWSLRIPAGLRLPERCRWQQGWTGQLRLQPGLVEQQQVWPQQLVR